MPEASSSFASPLNRRSFLTNAGVAAASLVLLTACPGPDKPPPAEPTLSLGTGDTGVLNYIYLLERFSGEFYAQVLATPAPDLTAADLSVLRDLHRHELAHRETLAQAFAASINGVTINSALPDMKFRFDSFTLTNRAGVLAAAQTVEDLGVAALCGAAKLFSSVYLLRLVMKMTAVEARHAAAVRDLRQAGSFAGADVVAQTGAEAGLNQVLTPTEVLAELTAKYSPIKLVPDSLPTS
jgi:hypothetical protein